MLNLGPPIAVATVTIYCDTRQHEITLITEGYQGYAYGPGQECLLARQADGTYQALCREVLGKTVSGELIRCDGEAWVSPEKLHWTADPEIIATLVCYGERIET